MKHDKGIGYIYSTGAGTSDPAQFQQLVTIDAPTRGEVIASCIGRQGPYFLSKTDVGEDTEQLTIHVLPMPDRLTDIKYDGAPKMTYIWRSKKFVLSGLTTMAAAKVVHGKGDVRLRIIVDGCCKYEVQVRSNKAFRLPPQVIGIEWELELIGTAQVFEVHVASSIEELLRA